MKIVSVNSKQTVDENEVAFNLDENLSPQLLEKLEYGSLSFRGERNVLIVTLDAEDNDPIGPETVQNINQHLEAAAEAVASEASKRKRMLALIARNADLPLD